MTCANPKQRQFPKPFRAQVNTMIIKPFYDGWPALGGQKGEGSVKFALFIQKNKLYHRLAATLYLPA